MVVLFRVCLRELVFFVDFVSCAQLFVIVGCLVHNTFCGSSCLRELVIFKDKCCCWDWICLDLFLLAQFLLLSFCDATTFFGCARLLWFLFTLEPFVLCWVVLYEC